MDKYKINFIFNNAKDINDILNNELKKYIQVICKNVKREVTLSCKRFSLEGDKNC